MKDIFKILDEMFPGDESLGLPIFSDISHNLRERFQLQAFSSIEKIESLIDSEVKFDSSWQALEHIRKHTPLAMRNLTIAALENYFAEPKVIKYFRNGPIKLFPNPRALPEIDFNLLEDVLNHHQKDSDS